MKGSFIHSGDYVIHGLSGDSLVPCGIGCTGGAFPDLDKDSFEDGDSHRSFLFASDWAVQIAWSY